MEEGTATTAVPEGLGPSAVELLGHQIVLVPNYDFNFKVTYPRDLPLAEFVLKQRANATKR